MSKLDLDQAEFLFHSVAIDDPTLSVVQFRGREALSQTFEFVVELCSDDPDLDLVSPIGQPACLTLCGRRADGSRYDRPVHGVVEQLVQVSAGIRHSRYEATLVPTIRPLTYTRDSRIFQKLTAPEVVQQVLRAQVTADWLHPLLHASYGPRDYCVQYQESDLDFAARLLEEEGICYFFEHHAEKDIMVLGDGEHAFDRPREYAEAHLRDRPHLYEEGLFALRAESALRAGAAVLRDFRFKQPGLELEARAQGARFDKYQLYYFPGEYVDPELGQRLARLRLEEQECQRQRFIGQGNVRAMLPGYRFTLDGHRRRDCNQEYLIVAVEHQGAQPGALGEEGSGMQKTSYQNRVECIPSGIRYRPPRITPRPSIPGVQTAVVVGPAGEEIHCDDHGRVKVQFHWDRAGKRDDNSSCWIRVSQPWGGAGQGGMFIPRVGQEVVVQFLEGDPDRPLIVGRVYNGENPVPHGLPAGKNISTIRSASTPGGGGFNELKFNDTAGSEEVFFHAQKDHNEVVGNNHDTKVGVDQSLNVGSNQSNTIGSNQNTSVGTDQSLDVGSNQSNTIGSNQSTSIGANQSTSVGANQSLSVGGNQDASIAGNQTLSVTGNQDTSISGNQSLAVTGSQTSNVVGSATTTVIGANTLTSLSGYTVTVVPNLAATVAANTSLQSGAQIGIQAPIIGTQAVAASTQALSVSTQGVLISSEGVLISIEGAVIGIKGGTINMEGGTVNVSGGTVSVSGGTVTVAGGGGAMTIDGGGVQISGSSVKISGGTVDIAGGVVSIN